MLEGKELEGNIGNVGTYSVDIDDHGILTVSVSAKVDILAEVEKLLAKTSAGSKIISFLDKLKGTPTPAA